VSAFFSHACALTAAGIVQCWGENNLGQLGSGMDTGNTTTPAAVTGGASYKAVSAGRQFTCALAADGTAQCWGRNAEGQLGTGDTSNKNTPTAVVAP
jgi:alpha-tubulin suppressor-like RCC1 family protein